MARFFQTISPDYFFRAYVTPDLQPLEIAVEAQKKSLRLLEKALVEYDKTNKRPTHKGDDGLFCASTVDSISEYSQRLLVGNALILNMQAQVVSLAAPGGGSGSGSGGEGWRSRMSVKGTTEMSKKISTAVGLQASDTSPRGKSKKNQKVSLAPRTPSHSAHLIIACYVLPRWRDKDSLLSPLLSGVSEVKDALVGATMQISQAGQVG